MINKALFSSVKDDWETPQALFDELHQEFNFNLDCCASILNAKLPHFFTIEDDGLAQEWSGTVWMNPPYGRGIINWVRKAFESAQKGAVVVGLLPVRSDTKWWHQFVMKSSEIRFLTRRLSFSNSDNKAAFPVAIVIFRQNQNSPILKAHKV